MFFLHDLAFEINNKRVNETLSGLYTWFQQSFPHPYWQDGLSFLQTVVDTNQTYFHVGRSMVGFRDQMQEGTPLPLFCGLEVKQVVETAEASRLLEAKHLQVAARTYAELMGRYKSLITSTSPQELIFKLDERFFGALRELHRVYADPLPSRLEHLLWANHCAYIALEAWSLATDTPNPIRKGMSLFRSFGAQVLWIDDKKRFTLLAKEKRRRHVPPPPPG